MFWHDRESVGVRMEENITIEFVKEWIDKHNLTKDSFDRIMNDLIYNSGHNYIDNPSLRYWLIDNTYKFRDMLPVELSDNQQIVLEELCSKFDSEIPFQSIYELVKYPEGEVGNRYADLSPLEDLEVLIAFAEWGMKNEQ